MKTQTFSNHVRVHALYHYFAVPASLALIPLSLVNIFINFGMAAIILCIATIVLHVTIFLARDYAKKNQDRIIRAELRLRYYQLTQQRLEEIETRLSTGQLLALRFSSDEEFIGLLRNPDTASKKPEEIKRQLIQWNADWMRV